MFPGFCWREQYLWMMCVPLFKVAFGKDTFSVEAMWPCEVTLRIYKSMEFAFQSEDPSALPSPVFHCIWTPEMRNKPENTPLGAGRNISNISKLSFSYWRSLIFIPRLLSFQQFFGLQHPMSISTHQWWKYRFQPQASGRVSAANCRGLMGMFGEVRIKDDRWSDQWSYNPNICYLYLFIK